MPIENTLSNEPQIHDLEFIQYHLYNILECIMFVSSASNLIKDGQDWTPGVVSVFQSSSMYYIFVTEEINEIMLIDIHEYIC